MQQYGQYFLRVENVKSVQIPGALVYKFCTVAYDICGCSEWNMMHVTKFFSKSIDFTQHILLTNVQLNKLHVSALLGHHQAAYRRLVSIKVQFAL